MNLNPKLFDKDVEAELKFGIAVCAQSLRSWTNREQAPIRQGYGDGLLEAGKQDVDKRFT